MPWKPGMNFGPILKEKLTIPHQWMQTKPKFKLTKSFQKAILDSIKLLDQLNFFVETK